MTAAEQSELLKAMQLVQDWAIEHHHPCLRDDLEDAKNEVRDSDVNVHLQPRNNP